MQRQLRRTFANQRNPNPYQTVQINKRLFWIPLQAFLSQIITGEITSFGSGFQISKTLQKLCQPAPHTQSDDEWSKQEFSHVS